MIGLSYVCKYPYLNKVILVNKYMKCTSEDWNELELVYLMNKKDILFVF